jgi:hypothetical protein
MPPAGMPYVEFMFALRAAAAAQIGAVKANVLAQPSTPEAMSELERLVRLARG